MSASISAIRLSIDNVIFSETVIVPAITSLASSPIKLFARSCSSSFRAIRLRSTIESNSVNSSVVS